MRPEFKRSSSIIAFVIITLSLLTFTAVCIVLIFTIKDITSEQIGTIVVLASLIDIVLFLVAIHFLRRGLRGYKSTKMGNKRQCKIIDIAVSKLNTWYKEVTVSYRGESGEQYNHVVAIDIGAARNLQVGQIIECYVLNERCYIDVDQPIKIIKQPEEDLKFE